MLIHIWRGSFFLRLENSRMVLLLRTFFACDCSRFSKRFHFLPQNQTLAASLFANFMHQFGTLLQRRELPQGGEKCKYQSKNSELHPMSIAECNCILQLECVHNFNELFAIRGVRINKSSYMAAFVKFPKHFWALRQRVEIFRARKWNSRIIFVGNH